MQGKDGFERGRQAGNEAATHHSSRRELREMQSLVELRERNGRPVSDYTMGFIQAYREAFDAKSSGALARAEA